MIRSNNSSGALLTFHESRQSSCWEMDIFSIVVPVLTNHVLFRQAEVFEKTIVTGQLQELTAILINLYI